MLEDFRFFVNFIPLKTKRIMQIGFEQSMAPDHFQCASAPLLSQGHFSIGLVESKPFSNQTLDLLRGRGNSNADTRSKETDRNTGLSVLFSAPDRLEIVLSNGVLAY